MHKSLSRKLFGQSSNSRPIAEVYCIQFPRLRLIRLPSINYCSAVRFPEACESYYSKPVFKRQSSFPRLSFCFSYLPPMGLENTRPPIFALCSKGPSTVLGSFTTHAGKTYMELVKNCLPVFCGTISNHPAWAAIKGKVLGNGCSNAGVVQF